MTEQEAAQEHCSLPWSPWTGVFGFSDADADADVSATVPLPTATPTPTTSTTTGATATSKSSDFSHEKGLRTVPGVNDRRFTRYFLADPTSLADSQNRRISSPKNSSTAADAPLPATASHYDTPDGRRWVTEMVMQHVKPFEACVRDSPGSEGLRDSAGRGDNRRPKTASRSSGNESDGNSSDGDAMPPVPLDPAFARYNSSATDVSDYLDWLVGCDSWALDPHNTQRPSKLLSSSISRETTTPHTSDSVVLETPRSLHAIIQVLRKLLPEYHSTELLHTQRQLQKFLRAGYKKILPKAHANFVDVFAIYLSSKNVNESSSDCANAAGAANCVDVFCKREVFTLQSALQFNRGAFRSFSDLLKRFVIFQLIDAVAFLHSHGIYHGGLRPESVFLTERLWVKVGLPFSPDTSESGDSRNLQSVRDEWLNRRSHCVFKPSSISRWTGKSVIQRWVDGDVSNFDYLMVLNRAAGRSMIDASFHAMMPWVVDFSSKDGGWRDLTRSKFRLKKGDKHLDSTFENSTPPHHVPESLSDITYYIYCARRTPINVLRSVVRQNFRAREYPNSFRRFFEWSPDECIPEFYASPGFLVSVHSPAVMEDLELPEWTPTPEEFIKWHREKLDSVEVARNLHHWIDLTFGFALSGAEAVRRKNVVISSDDAAGAGIGGAGAGGVGGGSAAGGGREGGSALLNRLPGFVQLFHEPHPRAQRRPISSGGRYSNVSRLPSGERPQSTSRDSRKFVPQYPNISPTKLSSPTSGRNGRLSEAIKSSSGEIDELMTIDGFNNEDQCPPDADPAIDVRNSPRTPPLRPRTAPEQTLPRRGHSNSIRGSVQAGNHSAITRSVSATTAVLASIGPGRLDVDEPLAHGPVPIPPRTSQDSSAASDADLSAFSTPAGSTSTTPQRTPQRSQKSFSGGHSHPVPRKSSFAAPVGAGTRPGPLPRSHSARKAGSFGNNGTRASSKSSNPSKLPSISITPESAVPFQAMDELHDLLGFVDRHAGTLEPAFCPRAAMTLLTQPTEKSSPANRSSTDTANFEAVHSESALFLQQGTDNDKMQFSLFDVKRRRDSFALGVLICMIFNHDGHAPLAHLPQRLLQSVREAQEQYYNSNVDHGGRSDHRDAEIAVGHLLRQQQGHNLPEPLIMAVAGLMTGSVDAEDLVNGEMYNNDHRFGHTEEVEVGSTYVHNHRAAKLPSLVRLSIFPSYFRELHNCLSSLVSCESWTNRLQRTQAVIGWILALPDDAVMIALPHITVLWACGSRGGGGGAKEITGFPTPDVHLGALGLFGPLARRLGRHLAIKELLPLIVALFENVVHLDWDNPLKEVEASPSADPFVGSAGQDAKSPASPHGAPPCTVADCGVCTSSDLENSEIPSQAEARQRARKHRQKLLLALVHTDMQLAFCQSFGPLEYIRVLFPYLEDSLYIFPSVAPEELATTVERHAIDGATPGGGKPIIATVSSLRGRTRSMRGVRGVYKGSDAGQESNLQYHAANAIVALGASKALGKTMAQRFVVPSVVRQVGRKRPAKMMACLEGSSVDAFERKELFRCVLELSAILGVEALDYVLDTLYQTVERLCQYYPPPKSGPSSPSASSKDGEIAPSTISRDALAMQEVFTVFSGLLQRLHQNTVIRKFFCRSGLTFPKILGALPEPADVDLHLGYVEALVFCCQCAGVPAVVQYVLPHVETFISRMSLAKERAEAAAVGNPRKQAKIRHVYITIIQTLYQTLASVVGPDVMQQGVPSGKLFADHLRIGSSNSGGSSTSGSTNSPPSSTGRRDSVVGEVGDVELLRRTDHAPGATGSPWVLDASQTFTAHEESVSAMAVCAREQLLCTGSSDSTVRCWRLRNNSRAAVERTYNGHRRRIMSLHTLAPGGGAAFQVASCDGAVDVWDIERGRRLMHYTASGLGGNMGMGTTDLDASGSDTEGALITATLAMPGDTQLACAAAGRIITYDMRCPSRQHGVEWQLSQSSTTCGPIHSLAIVGSYVVAAGSAGAALLDARLGLVVQRWTMSGRDLSRMVAFGDDRVAAVKSNGKCYIWNVRDTFCGQLYHEEVFAHAARQTSVRSSTFSDRNRTTGGGSAPPGKVSSFGDHFDSVLFHQINSQPKNLRTLGDIPRDPCAVDVAPFCSSNYHADELPRYLFVADPLHVRVLEMKKNNNLPSGPDSLHNTTIPVLDGHHRRDSSTGRGHVTSLAIMPMKGTVLVGTDSGAVQQWNSHVEE